MSVRLALCVAAAFSGVAWGHGISPTRLEAPSGSQYVAYRFTAYNMYKQAQEFDVECFREDFDNRIACNAIPKNFWVPAQGKRLVKIQIPTEGKDGVYLACTIQAVPDGLIQTRVCARIGVGVDPAPVSNSGRKRDAAAGAAVSTRARPNKGG